MREFFAQLLTPLGKPRRQRGRLCWVSYQEQRHSRTCFLQLRIECDERVRRRRAQNVSVAFLFRFLKIRVSQCK